MISLDNFLLIQSCKGNDFPLMNYHILGELFALYFFTGFFLLAPIDADKNTAIFMTMVCIKHFLYKEVHSMATSSNPQQLA